ncbi:unnamed protein product, partial [Amoebophrya sp. A25]
GTDPSKKKNKKNKKPTSSSPSSSSKKVDPSPKNKKQMNPNLNDPKSPATHLDAVSPTPTQRNAKKRAKKDDHGFYGTTPTPDTDLPNKGSFEDVVVTPERAAPGVASPTDASEPNEHA